MGRVKSTLIKSTTRKLLSAHGDDMTDNFEENKKRVSKYIDTNKRLRNSIAGYVTRLKKKE
ncbi:MAG: 30S ribosomal protein S17e [archaeon]